MWAEKPRDRRDAPNGLFDQTQIQLPNMSPTALDHSQRESREYCEYSKMASNNRDQTSLPAHSYMYLASLPPTEPFSTGMRIPENDNRNTNAEPLPCSTNNDLDFQTYNSVVKNEATSRAESLGGVLDPTRSTDGNNLQDAWITPPSSSHQLSSVDDKISQEKVNHGFQLYIHC